MSSGGGDSGSGARQEQEENRKVALRDRIDRLYGVKEPSYTEKYRDPSAASKGNMLEQARDAVRGGSTLQKRAGVKTRVVIDPDAMNASQQMEDEKTQLAEATRQYHADQLGLDYKKAERNTRFKLARQGLLGGSEDAFQQGEVKSDRDLGATRVDEAVRRAISNLTSQREQERLNAIGLANSGAGDSAVSAAQAGLRNSFENVANQQKADLFTDLFSNSADAVTANNSAENQAALLGRYRDRLSTFFPSRSTSSGRVTPSA